MHIERNYTLVNDDSVIHRNRSLRTISAFGTPVACLILGWAFGFSLAWWFSIPHFIGWSAGLGIGAYYAKKAWNRSTIKNDATIGFVTIDPLASLFPTLAKLFGLTVLTSYGPGNHFCFWWERRSKENVVNLVESAEPVSVVVQTGSGGLTLEGETRFRPNLGKLSTFINGVAAVASDVTGLIEASVVSRISGDKRPLQDVLADLGTINEKLREDFQENKTGPVTAFEERFAVTVGDTTMSRILPSKEVQETLSAVTESAVIDEMVAKSFGCDSYAILMERVAAGKPTWAQVNQVRTQKMAASGNLQGMDLRDHTFNLNVSGLDTLTPESAAAFAGMLGTFVSRQQGSEKASKKGGAK